MRVRVLISSTLFTVLVIPTGCSTSDDTADSTDDVDETNTNTNTTPGSSTDTDTDVDTDADTDETLDGADSSDTNTDDATSDPDSSDATDETEGAVCGNGVIEANEECDGAELGGLTCVDFGFPGGTLSCEPGNCVISTGGCMAAGSCGWDLNAEIYQCGLSGEDPDGTYPIECPPGLLQGTPCADVLSFRGCCDENQDLWYCGPMQLQAKQDC